MKVLVACEYSGVVRDAFIAQGHDAWSCDLRDTDQLGPHYCGDVRDILGDGWDLMVAHPPCTYLTVTGNKWFKPEFADRFPTRHQDRQDAHDFFMLLSNARIPRIAIENPIGVMSTLWRKPDQIIQPHMFGHPTTKGTCLWLKGLPKLAATNNVEPEWVAHKSGNRTSKWYYETSLHPLAEREKLRSVTFQGIADAMADQWGKIMLDSTEIREYNSSTVKQETAMSQCSICSEIQFMSPTGITCKNGHDNAPAQQRVALEGSATMDNKAVLDSSPKPQVENQVPIDKLVKIYVKIRDALSAEKKKYETIEAEFKGQMAMIATELKARAQAEGVEGFRTDFGTVYMSETMKTSCADWSAFGEFLKDHDPLEFLEKRISSTAIKEYMKQTDGQLPPGVSIFKELEARVRRSGEK